MRRLLVLTVVTVLFASLSALPAQAAGGGAFTKGHWTLYSDGSQWEVSNNNAIYLRATRTCTANEKPVAEILIKNKTAVGPQLVFLISAGLRMYSDDIGGPGYKEKTGPFWWVTVTDDWQRLEYQGVNFRVIGPDNADVNGPGEGMIADVIFDDVDMNDEVAMRGKIWCANA